MKQTILLYLIALLFLPLGQISAKDTYGSTADDYYNQNIATDQPTSDAYYNENLNYRFGPGGGGPGSGTEGQEGDADMGVGEGEAPIGEIPVISFILLSVGYAVFRMRKGK
ncbi:hypothetical protein M2132_001708 [Dysgonomonas sp. PH5-45]|uniref:hypothetical protein n=1 Tax=unclassified Dysgonomonas TaxID=2630389 RepID=UPI0024761A60|nr:MULTISPECIES: hypothetical protein [unclassified Dysgonomonas]MDH6355367.1 hypothetical protein [Dysgonomonas sp. PH5-45]MDH6388265.1 hypothetical protein [Dysgonomonas sp. PH5-37]